MYVKINKPTAKTQYNSSTCIPLVKYLSKEQEQKGEQVKFFNNRNENISSFEVIDKIDNNKAKLGKDEAKYYMLSINPSKHEQQHIISTISPRKINSIEELTKNERVRFEQKLKEYARNVMDGYARNFNREILDKDGITKRQMNGNDLLYYGQIEHSRKYSLEDAKRDIKKISGNISKTEENELSNKIISRQANFSNDVKSKISKCDDIRKAEIYSRIGMQKEGLQSHVHVIVSRKDIENKIKLSPFANARNAKNTLDGRSVQIGFDRKKFVQTTENKFDSMFEYQRQLQESFKYKYEAKNLLTNSLKYNLKQTAKNITYSTTGIGGVGHTLDTATKVKDPLDAARLLVSQNAIASNCLKIIGNAANPTKLAIDIAKKLGQQIIQASSL